MSPDSLAAEAAHRARRADWVRTRMPLRVYQYLRSGFVQHEAHDLLGSLRDHGGYSHGDVVHPGDPGGAVLAWLWRDEPGEAMALLAGFIAQLRMWDELAAAQDPPVRLEDLLTTLPMALPGDFPDSEAEALISRAEPRCRDCSARTPIAEWARFSFSRATADMSAGWLCRREVGSQEAP